MRVFHLGSGLTVLTGAELCVQLSAIVGNDNEGRYVGI